METAMIIPQLSGTEMLMPKTQGSDKGNESENSEFGFLDEFLSILISNMNPNEMNLDSNTSQKLSQYLNKELNQNEILNSLDKNAFLSNLKSELSNSKPHKLSLDGLKNTIKNLLKINNKELKYQRVQLSDSKENIAQLVEQLKSASNNDGLDNKFDKFLQNIRKYLTKEEFETVRKNLLSQSKNELKQTTTKVNALNKFISTIESKEEVAKNKISAKTENLELKYKSKALNNVVKSETTTKTDNPIVILKDVQESEKETQKPDNQNLKAKNIELNITDKAIDKSAIQSVAKDQTQSKESNVKIQENYVGLEKEMKLEQSANNGSEKDGSTEKEMAKHQTKEQIKQSFTKNEIADLIGKSNSVKKSETKKTENIVKSNFIEKTINSIKMTKSGGSNVARIMLQPRSLGNLTMRISLTGNNVKLYIKADKSEAAEHIDRQLPLLKERMAENGLKVDQIVIESSDSERLTDNQKEKNRNEQEELRRQFVKSFGNTAAKRNFDISIGDVEYFNSSPYEGYTKAGSKINV